MLRPGLTLLGIFCLFGCGRLTRNRSHAQVPMASIQKGKELAAVYCGSCHGVPDPALLDSRSWEKGVLPAMGPRLGIFYHRYETYPATHGDPSIGNDFYPSKALLKPEEWQHVLDYYSATSPDTLPGQSRPYPIKEGLG